MPEKMIGNDGLDNAPHEQTRHGLFSWLGRLDDVWGDGEKQNGMGRRKLAYEKAKDKYYEKTFRSSDESAQSGGLERLQNAKPLQKRNSNISGSKIGMPVKIFC